MNAKILRMCLCAAACSWLGVPAQGAIFIPTVDNIIYDGEPFGVRDGVPDRLAGIGGTLDVFNATPLEARTVIEFAPGLLSEPVTSARLVLPVFTTNGPFPIKLDLYAYRADGVIDLTDFAAGSLIASMSYSNQTYVVFDVTGVVSEFATGGVSRIGFNLRAPEVSPVMVNAPFVAFYSLEADFYFNPVRLTALFVNDTDGDGVGDHADQCPDTAFGSVVNESGCSLEQLCPCEGPWTSQRDYLRCVRGSVRDFLDAGRITKEFARTFLSEAVHSDCGR